MIGDVLSAPSKEGHTGVSGRNNEANTAGEYYLWVSDQTFFKTPYEGPATKLGLLSYFQTNRNNFEVFLTPIFERKETVNRILNEIQEAIKRI